MLLVSAITDAANPITSTAKPGLVAIADLGMGPTAVLEAYTLAL
jgi:hypothetical protein